MSDRHYRSIATSPIFHRIKDHVHNNPQVLPSLTLTNWKQDAIVTPDLHYHYAGRGVSSKLKSLMQEMVDDCQLIAQYEALRSGAIINRSESRSVQHHALRDPNPDSFYQKEWSRIQDFIKEKNQEPTPQAVIQIGIGGSELGPKLLVDALKSAGLAQKKDMPKSIFLSNIDKDSILSKIQDIDLARTIWIVVSKSGSTLETREIFNFLCSRLPHNIDQHTFIQGHVISISSDSASLAQHYPFRASFYMKDSIGGRYSVTSACGLCVGGLVYSIEMMNEVLAGAHEMDNHAAIPQVHQNMALFEAVLGVIDRNIYHRSAQAIIPYTSAFQLLPAYLQQLENESNGKSVNRHNQPIDYPTSQVIFGEPGTNAQHSFFQYLHQGNPIIPVQFIGIQSAFESGEDNLQQSLLANMIGQLIALVEGQHSDNPNTHFEGGRPVSVILAKKLTPRVMGALISFYENVTMFKGFLWDLNSFDQEGVTLGKQVAQGLLTSQVESEHSAIFSDVINA